MKILIIEDDTDVLAYICKGLREAGHTTDEASEGKQGLFLATTEQYDVIVTDRMLPQLDGLTFIKTLRGAGNTTPVIILSALDKVDDRVEGLRSGSDDYLVKPFSFAELLARIEIIAKRTQVGAAADSPILQAGDLVLDKYSRKVSRGQKAIRLMSQEFKLLAYLLEHKGQVVTRTMLLEHVWDYHFDPQTNVIDVHISRLRRKIDKGYDQPVIRTMRGAGYIIED